MNDPLRYQSAQATRNASLQMQAIWSPQRKFSTWRRLWLALAEAEQDLGLAISDEQLDQMRSHLDDIDFESAAEYEKKTRHDVMAHVHTYGVAAPAAAGIIHLGATSQFINCNTELLLINEALQMVAAKLAGAIDALAFFAIQYRALPTLGFTHFQPAQPTTVGKRAALWAQDMSIALKEIEHRIDSLQFRGIKGTTGTQASFLKLFDGDHDKVERLDYLVTEKMGWPGDKRFTITGQTYPRVLDGLVHGSLAAVAATAQKFATDMRLLAHMQELAEPFEKDQIGSSAMAYKRNPMRSERICGLARFVIGLTTIPFTTAAEQWLERTLDDSSTRRLVLPESFLAVDGLLDVLNNVVSGIVVYKKMVEANLARELPFLATENVLMAAVQAGGNRQKIHEIIRDHSLAAAERIKTEAEKNDLADRLRQDPAFTHIDIDVEMQPAKLIGRAPQQVDAFIEEVVEPIRARYRNKRVEAVELRV